VPSCDSARWIALNNDRGGFASGELEIISTTSTLLHYWKLGMGPGGKMDESIHLLGGSIDSRRASKLAVYSGFCAKSSKCFGKQEIRPQIPSTVFTCYVLSTRSHDHVFQITVEMLW
jgi:hypothetical protein